MSGTVSWNATFVPGVGSIRAELYDGSGNTVRSSPVPCKPPVNCHFEFDGVENGTYLGALAVGNDRYYYVEGKSVITDANDLNSASQVEITDMDQEVEINIYVNLF